MRSVSKNDFMAIKDIQKFYELDMSLPEGKSSDVVKFYGCQIGENQVLLICIFNNDFPSGFNIIDGEIVEFEGKYIVDRKTIVIPNPLKVETVEEPIKEEQPVIEPVVEEETQEDDDSALEAILEESKNEVPDDQLEDVLDEEPEPEKPKEEVKVKNVEEKRRNTFEEDLASFDPEKMISNRLEERQLAAMMGSVYDKEYVKETPKEEVKVEETSNQAILEKLRNNTVIIEEEKKSGPYVRHGEKKSGNQNQQKPKPHYNIDQNKVNKPTKEDKPKKNFEDDQIINVFNPFGDQDDFVF